MARINKSLALKQFSSTSLETLYTVPPGRNTSISNIFFTNTADNDHIIKVYKNNGTSDFLIGKVTLPAGEGVSRNLYDFQNDVYNAGFIIKLQSDNAGAYNASASGIEVET
jgi:hypothetical protein